MIKNLLLGVALMATTFGFAQTGPTVTWITNPAENATLTIGESISLSASYDAGDDGGDPLVEYEVGSPTDTNNLQYSIQLRTGTEGSYAYSWKGGQNDATALNTHTGTSSLTWVIPDLPVSSTLTGDEQYVFRVGYQNSNEAWSSGAAEILITIEPEAPWAIDFEDTDPAYVYTLGHQGTTQTSTAIVANPVGTTGNDTGAKVAQFTVNSNVGSWAYPFLGLNADKTLWNNTLGKVFSLKFLAPVAAGDINLYLWSGSNKQTAITTSYTGGSMTTWKSIEFDTSSLGLTEGDEVTRMDIEFSAGVNLVAGHVYYFDDVTQSVGSVLNTEVVENNNVVVYPNPTTGIINISDVSDINAISITNIAGQVVANFGAQNTIDISNLATGVYILQADNGLKRKIVKK
jgi:hypothetical protein